MKHYKTILIDPPWNESGGGKIKRGADRHYPLMKTKDIVKTIKECKEFRPDDSCHLWLWVTKNFLPDAFKVIEELGFKYKTSAVWVKVKEDIYGKLRYRLRNEYGVSHNYEEFIIDEHNVIGKLQIGLGQYLRGAHELLLLATKGKAMVPPPKNRLPDVIFAERTKHSKKPEESYKLIETCSPGPRLEMFARDSSRKGWDFWENEI